ncbi:MAG: S9 family peptidase [Marinifilaceae bacterium]|jgi:dipeptidyl aminopeptidase/acylaminoacyl peptidase|nr:S9 family peptidase [Marinifilaceae bacterium]
MKKISILILLAIVFYNCYAQKEKEAPSFEQVLSLRHSYNPIISPDSKAIIYSQRYTDWENNSFDRELFLIKENSEAFQLTNTLKASSYNAKWSPDGKWISFITKSDKLRQIFVIRRDGGESFQVSKSKTNILDYKWSPDGKFIIYSANEDIKKKNKERKQNYGSFFIDEKNSVKSKLYIMDFNSELLNKSFTPAMIKDTCLIKEDKLLLEDDNFTIGSFMFADNGTKLLFEHNVNDLANNSHKQNISILDLKTSCHKLIVNNSSCDFLIDVSPNGDQFIFKSNLNDTTGYYYANTHILVADLNGENIKELAKNSDNEIYNIKWTKNGIYGIRNHKTFREFVNINPTTGELALVSNRLGRIKSFSVCDNSSMISLAVMNEDGLTEIYKADLNLKKSRKLTEYSKQISNWRLPESELIHWKSKDNIEIEGVLYKPDNFDPKKKYPLLVVVHGGPAMQSYPKSTPGYVYPIIQWVNKGAIVLEPNYRGSIGYGKKFMSLNVENLGVGDSWDVLSGVGFLESQNIVDSDKIAVMGWSQGGYISAYLTTNTNKFAAVSVGAGISNWITYYVNTDIHPFTIQYLKSTPWQNHGIYEKTSPITNIKNATTPTLIQHGEYDKRVPIANAYELIQGLRDNNVESELIIYKGFGHGITKPKEKLAATLHNWEWFGKYLWGEKCDLKNLSKK